MIVKAIIAGTGKVKAPIKVKEGNLEIAWVYPALALSQKGERDKFYNKIFYNTGYMRLHSPSIRLGILSEHWVVRVGHGSKQ